MILVNLGDRIHFARKKAGLTLADLGKAVGVGASTVRKWETGDIKNFKSNKLKLIAEALDVSVAWLMGWEENVYLYENIEPIPSQKAVPIIGTIACGEPILAEENLEGLAYIDEDVTADFALKCKGDSMINARIFDGDIVYIREQPDVENGEIAAVLIENEATLKRVYKFKDSIELRAENPIYPVLIYRNEALDNIKILGKAIMFKSLVR